MIPDAVVVSAVETVLNSIGTSIKHYMPASKADAMEAMRGVLQAERERFLATVEEVRVSPQWSGQHADWICSAIVEASK